MVTYVLPLEKDAIEVGPNDTIPKFNSLKSLIIGDPTLQQPLTYILIITFDSEKHFQRWKEVLSQFTDEILRRQDDKAIDDGSFFYAMGVLHTLDSNDEKVNSENQLLQVPEDKLNCLAYLNGIEANFIGNTELLKHFKSREEDIYPNFKVMDLVEENSKIIKLQSENNVRNIVPENKPPVQLIYKTRHNETNTVNKNSAYKSQVIENKKKGTPKVMYLIVGVAWLCFLWNVFFKYLDTTSATIAVILLTIAGFSLASNGKNHL